MKNVMTSVWIVATVGFCSTSALAGNPVLTSTTQTADTVVVDTAKKEVPTARMYLTQAIQTADTVVVDTAKKEVPTARMYLTQAIQTVDTVVVDTAKKEVPTAGMYLTQAIQTADTVVVDTAKKDIPTTGMSLAKNDEIPVHMELEHLQTVMTTRYTDATTKETFENNNDL